MENLNSRNFTLDFLKAICCFLMVILHFSAFYNSAFKIIIRSVTAVAVPCFMSISGYLIFYQKEYTYKHILKGVFLKYLCIFLLWDLVYIIWYYFRTGQTGSFITYAVTNSEGWHLWYLKVHIQILLVFPLVKVIVKETELVKMYSLLWTVFILLKFSFSIFPGMNFIYLRLVQLPFFQFSGYIGGTLAGYYPMEALGYYIAGGYLIKTIEDCANKGFEKCKIFLVIGSVGGIATAFVTCCFVKYIGWDHFDWGLQPYCIWVYAETIGFITFICLILKYISVSNRFRDIVEWLSSKTLGIYILHIMIMKELQRLSIFSGLREGDIKYIFLLILTIAGSLSIVTILKIFLPDKVNKYII